MAQGHAQVPNPDSGQDSFEDFRRTIHTDFESFRKKCMEEFIDFVRNPWKEFERQDALPKPREEPVPPVVRPDDDKDGHQPIEDRPIIIDNVVEPLPVEPQPEPIEPIEETPVMEVKHVDFSFFGTPCKVRFDSNGKIALRGVDANSIADGLAALSEEAHENMLLDCLGLRNDLQLGDWAYLLMLDKLASSVYGSATNEATLLTAYLYMQSGYKMRLAVNGNKLFMLYASKHRIYERTNYTISGDTYYGLGELPPQLFVCETAFPNEKEMSLLVQANQLFEYQSGIKRHISSERYPGMSVSVAPNKNLIDFYGTYPSSMIGDNFMTTWAVYANTPMETEVREQLYPKLRECMAGKSQLEAVNMLLNFVQTGFEYEFDNKIWGHDRTFFAEESLYYPYCDCEDRSILLTRLVRDLLGLKCILVYYPGHLASAVEFTEAEAHGDYISLDGHKYVIADATFINAPVGMTMTGMDNSRASVILLD